MKIPAAAVQSLIVINGTIFCRRTLCVNDEIRMQCESNSDATAGHTIPRCEACLPATAQSSMDSWLH
jgi:hypothetical protein